jgi:hypothetical protein
MFYIHEVYYNDNGDITAISEDPMHPHGETPEDLKNDLQYFSQAFKRPILKKEKITFAPMDGMESGKVKRKGRKH